MAQQAYPANHESRQQTGRGKGIKAIYFLLLAAISLSTSLLFTTSPPQSLIINAQAQEAPEQGDELISRPQRIYVPHWSNENGRATIYIRNVDIRQAVTAKLSLLLKHRAISLPETHIDSLQTITIDVAQALMEQGERIEQSGGAIIDFMAESDSALAAYAEALNPDKGLIFSFPFLPGTTPAMPGGATLPGPLEAVAWFFDKHTDAFIALQNTTDKPAVAIPSMFVSGKEINLGQRHLRPNEAVTIKLPSPRGLGSEDGPYSAGVRVAYSGEPGAVEAHGWVVNDKIGFSARFTFHRKVNDCHCPDGIRHLYGTGIAIGTGAMMGMAPGATFSPYLAMRNRSGNPITVHPIFSYEQGDGVEAVSLPAVLLNPQESALVNLRDYQESGIIPSGGNDGSIDLQYQGEAGALIAELASVDQDGSFVSPVPLTCNGQRMTEMAYWRTDEDWHSSLSLKNIAAEEMELEIKISHAGGIYEIEKELAPGATTMVSINEIQQSQESDGKGRRIPLDATLGGVSIRSRNGVNGLVMNAMLVNPSTKTCLECGLNGYVRHCVLTDDPNSVATFKYTIHRQVDEDFGMYIVVTWSTGFQEIVSVKIVGNSNPAVAVVSNETVVTTLSPGTTTLRGRTYNNYPLDRNCTVYGKLETAGDLKVHARVSVNEVGFKNDHKITVWPSGVAIDPSDNAPTWTSGSGNPNYPAAYTKGSGPTMFAKLGIAPSLSVSDTANVRVKNGTTVIATKSGVTLSGSSVQITDMVVAVLESNVKTTTPTFSWEITYNNGQQWIPMGNTGPHTFHWTYAAPLSPPFKNDNGNTYTPLYDLALEKACGYANGSSAVGTIISRINQGVDGDISYNPAESIGTQHPLKAYSTPGGCQCSDLANLLRGLLRSIGIDGTTLYIWAGPDSSTIRRYIRGSTGAGFQSFRIIRGQHDGAELNPHFSFHSVVSANGTWYDPSYGLSYSSLTFSETAFNNTPQQVSPGFWSNSVNSGFTCPH